MRDDKNDSQLDEITHLFKNSSVLHDSLLPFIPLDKKDKQNTWFSSIIKYNKGFIEDVKIGLSEADKCPSMPSSGLVPSQETTLGGDMESQDHSKLNCLLIFSMMFMMMCFHLTVYQNKAVGQA